MTLLRFLILLFWAMIFSHYERGSVLLMEELRACLADSSAALKHQSARHTSRQPLASHF